MPGPIARSFASESRISATRPPYAPPSPSPFDATIRLPGGIEGVAPEKVVRPALAILFRTAVGPSADRYVRRFLSFERTGRGRPGWHWPSLLIPGVWAFYRKLWLPGLVFALLPIAGALAFAAFERHFDRADFAWIASAVLAVWILPGVLPALCADALLYRRVKRLVRSAEHGAKGAADAVARLAQRRPTSISAGVCLGGGAMLAMTVILFPQFQAAYSELGIRAQVAQTLAALHVVERDIEAGWSSSRLLPRQTDHKALSAQPGAALIDEVSVSPVTGRVRVALGSGVPELAGKTILLAPRRDDEDRVQWVCVPVDIPPQYLPRECRG
jgi:hypothetical protein